MCGIHVAYILCVEKRKFLAFKQCITKVNLTGMSLDPTPGSGTYQAYISSGFKP